MLLMKRQHVAETDLNVRPDQKLCVFASGLAALALIGAWWLPWLLMIVAAGPAAIVALNASFYRFLLRKRGVGFAIGSVPLHLVYYGCCGLSVLIALVLWQYSARPAIDEMAVNGGSIRRRDAAEVAGQPATRPATRRSSRWTRR